MEVISNKDRVIEGCEEWWIGDFKYGDVIVSRDDDVVMMVTDEDYVCVLYSSSESYDAGELFETHSGELDYYHGPFKQIHDAAIFTKYFDGK